MPRVTTLWEDSSDSSEVVPAARALGAQRASCVADNDVEFVGLSDGSDAPSDVDASDVDADGDGDGDSEDYYSVSTGSLDGHDARRRRRALTERNLLSYLAHALAPTALAQPHTTTRATDDLHLLSPTLTSTRVWDFGRSGEDSDDDDDRHDNE